MIEMFFSRMLDIIVGQFNWPYIGACIGAIWLVFYVMPQYKSSLGLKVKVLICLTVEVIMALLFIGIFYYTDNETPASTFSYSLALSFVGVTFFYNIVVEPFLGKYERKVFK